MYGNYYPYQTQSASQQQLIRVSGMDGAKAFQMMPNCTAALFDSSDDIMYIKSTDGAGFGTIRTFHFDEIKTTPSPSTNYVTREEFESLRKELKDAKQFISRSAAAERTDEHTTGISESD